MPHWKFPRSAPSLPSMSEDALPKQRPSLAGVGKRISPTSGEDYGKQDKSAPGANHMTDYLLEDKDLITTANKRSKP